MIFSCRNIQNKKLKILDEFWRSTEGIITRDDTKLEYINTWYGVPIKTRDINVHL